MEVPATYMILCTVGGGAFAEIPVARAIGNPKPLWTSLTIMLLCVSEPLSGRVVQMARIAWRAPQL